MTGASEESIQRAFVEWLSVMEKADKLTYWAIPNQTPRPSLLTKLIGREKVSLIYSMIENALQLIGKRPGIPDLHVVFRDGRSILFEMKSKDGRELPSQKYWRQRLSMFDVPVYVTREVTEAIDIVQNRLKEMRA